MKARLCYLDALKGILIILVILGHAVQGTVPNYLHNPLFRFIYSFHMPLFFAVSGFLTYKSIYDNELVKKRAVQLLIPFVVWAFILPLLKSGNIVNMDSIINTLLYPDNGLWFLYNLFFYCVIFNLSERWAAKSLRQEYILVGFVIFLYLLMVFHTLFNVTQICWYIPFFAIGYYGRKYADILRDKVRLILVCCGIIYCISEPFWMMRGDPLFYQWINLGSVFSYLYRYLVEIVGTVFFFMLGRKFLNRPLCWLDKLGAKTLGIYPLQFIVLYYLDFLSMDNEPLEIVVKTVVAVPVCYVITELIHRVKYVRVLLIGGKL